jgi:hypothetical protein
MTWFEEADWFALSEEEGSGFCCLIGGLELCCVLHPAMLMHVVKRMDERKPSLNME